MTCVRIGIILLLTTLLLQAQVVLVREGQPVAEIVIGEEPVRGIVLAAEDLQAHLKQITGARLPIVAAPGEAASQVYIGASAHTAALGFEPHAFDSSGLEILAQDGYVILDGPLEHWQATPYTMTVPESRYLRSSIITGKVYPKPEEFPSPGLKAWQDFCGEKFTTHHLNNPPGHLNKALGIYTNDDIGPWYAVSELLEQLGVRWYMPYEHGTILPDLTTIVIPEQHLVKEAAFPRREYTYYRTMQEDEAGIRWMKRLKVGNNRLILYNHTTYGVYSSYEQQQLHPEYLARNAAGEFITGYPPGAGMPRFSHPGFRQAAATYMRKVLDAQPQLWAVTVGPPDGGIVMDARDVDTYGEPNDSLPQKTSNYLWDYYVYLADELAKTHPDKYLLYMAGAGANLVPTNITRWPKNLLIPPVARPSSTWVLDTQRRAQLQALQTWTQHMDEVVRTPTWDHWLSYRTPDRPRYPVIFTRSLQQQMQELHPYIDGKFIEIQPDNGRDADGKRIYRLGEIGLVHLMVYLQNKLFWDPNLDLPALLDDYYRLFFGPAEEQMRAFYTFAEEVWSRQASRSLTEHTGFLREPDVDRYFELLAAARQAAGEGTVYDTRIAMIEEAMQPLKKLFPNLKRTGPWIRAYHTPDDLAIDGDVSEYRYGWRTLGDVTTGEVPAKNRTQVVIGMTRDRSALVIGAICYDNRMDNLLAACAADDDFSIFQDDVIEIYLNTPTRSYFKIAINPLGAVWTESTDVAIIDRDTLPVLWNPKLESVVQHHDDRWGVEVRIPTDDFGDLGPSKTHPWGIQLGRSRFTGGHPRFWSISPTGGGPYRTLNRWGNLWVR